jgi:hypothetical protein
VWHYQYPPTLRLQPGPGAEAVREHSDAMYGHQDGEVNVWLPLSQYAKTRTTLWAESAQRAGDFRALEVDVGEAFVFHGTSCRHRVPPNPTPFTRVSLDFRIGVGAHFDPLWSKQGSQHDHARRRVLWDGEALCFDPHA